MITTIHDSKNLILPGRGGRTFEVILSSKDELHVLMMISDDGRELRDSVSSSTLHGETVP